MTPDATWKEIKACVFDAYGTLFDVHAAAARKKNRLGDHATPLSEIWRLKQIQYTWQRSLMGTYADFERVTAEALDFALASVGMSEEKGLKEELMGLYRELDAYPDAKEALTVLKGRGFGRAILSNGSPGMLNAAVDAAGIGPLLEQTISVDDIGIYKPHPSVYRMAEERLGLDKSEIAFVSSNGWDATGAATYGFKTLWINRFNQQPETLPHPPDAVIASLAEIPALLAEGPGS